MEESLLDQNITNCSLANITTCTSINSSDNSSFTAVEDDRGVVHLMGPSVCANVHLLDNLEVTPYEIVTHNDLTTRPDEPDIHSVPHYYVFSEFSEVLSSLYSKMMDNKKFRILGVPAVLQCLTRNISLSSLIPRKRTCKIFNIAMIGVTVCFTGFSSKTELNKLRKMVKCLGGEVTSDYNNKLVTHLVVDIVGTDKFNSCANLGEPIVTREWIEQCYQARHDLYLNAWKLYEDNPKLVPPIFHNLHIAFHGFTQPDIVDYKDLCKQNGATFVEPDDAKCNYIVVQNGLAEESYPKPNNKYCAILCNEWFWESIQLDQCANPMSYSATKKPDHKRKRSMDGGDTDTPLKKRNSIDDASGATFSNTSVSSLDITPVAVTKNKKLAANKRYLIASELLETEKNYVKQLSILLTSYKDGLEAKDSKGQLLVTTEECKIMFTNIADIHQLHYQLKERLCERLEQWKSDPNTQIGDVIADSSATMHKTYLPFLVKFDIIKGIIADCERENQKFKAFLKLRENNPQCRRLSLRDLLIEPVQRLPRITLLLAELIKKTPTAHTDYASLCMAQQNIKNVLDHLNNQKGNVDTKVEVCEVLEDIIGFPREKVVWSTLRFIRKVSIMSDCEALGNIGTFLTMFYFNEMIVIAKARIKGGSVNSNTPSTTVTRQNKYKHVELVRMSWISKIIDVEDEEDKFLIVWREEEKETPGSQPSKRKSSVFEEQTVMCRLVLDVQTKASFLDELSATTLAIHNRPIVLANQSITGDKDKIPLIKVDSILDVMTSAALPFLKSTLLAKHSDRKDSKDEKSDVVKYFNLAKRSMSRAFTHKQGKNSLRKTQSTTLASIFESKPELDVRKSPRTPTLGKRSFNLRENR